MQLLIVPALFILAGCAEQVPLQPQDIVGNLWLRANTENLVEGFFAGEDGLLLLIDKPALSGVSWSLAEDRLLLGMHDADGGATLSRHLVPMMTGGSLRLVTSGEEAVNGYVRSQTQEPLFRKRYHPVYLADAQAVAESAGSEPVYLQFDSQLKAVHGFGGVNNFHGRYQRTGKVDFSLGPLASTMMTGAGMDYELQLIEALGLADTMLAFGNRLLFYHDAKLLIHLQAP